MPRIVQPLPAVHDLPFPVADDAPSRIRTPGLLPSLGWAIEDWLGRRSTPEEEIAVFIGWTVEEVREHR